MILSAETPFSAAAGTTAASNTRQAAETAMDRGISMPGDPSARAWSDNPFGLPLGREPPANTRIITGHPFQTVAVAEQTQPTDANFVLLHQCVTIIPSRVTIIPPPEFCWDPFAARSGWLSLRS